MAKQEHARVADHYDAVAGDYHLQYERDRIFKNEDYPANYFRLQMLLNSFVSKGIKNVIEIGVGDGTPLATLRKAGMEVCGFDIASNMVQAAKKNVHKAGIDSERIIQADIQDPLTYAELLRYGPFDGLMAMGVMPHVENDDAVIANMAALIKPGGSAFIEFRNKLFSLFTFNSHTAEFIQDDLLQGVDPRLKAAVQKELEPRLRMDLPPKRNKSTGGRPGYDAILSKFHNPFEVPELFKEHFKDPKFRWYHYHPAMPMLEQRHPELFRTEAVKLEHESSGWKGMFLCSAFVVEAVRI